MIFEPGDGVREALVVHAQWSDGQLRVWAECASRHAGVETAGGGDDPGVDRHPFAATRASVASALSHIGVRVGEASEREETLEVLLPAGGGDARPLPSAPLSYMLGLSLTEDAESGLLSLRSYRVEVLSVSASEAEAVLEGLLERGGEHSGVVIGPTVRFLASAVRLARHLLVQQRFVPMLAQESDGGLQGTWRPWLNDEQTAERVRRLLESMPPAARAAVDSYEHSPWSMLEDLLSRVVDAGCRRTLRVEEMAETLERFEGSGDPHVLWLGGLLDDGTKILAEPGTRQEMVRRVRRWIGGLEERGDSVAWRLCLRLNEPADASLVQDLAAPPESVYWTVSFHLQAVDEPSVLLDAADIWALATDSLTVEGRRVESPQELLLGELGRASRLFGVLEKALDEPEPVDVRLSTKQAYEFLREVRPLLAEQGFGVEIPEWWDSPAARLGARLRLEGIDGSSGIADGENATNAAGARLGLGTLVSYKWEIAVGDTSLTLHEFEKLAQRGSPLVRVGGRWVEIRPEDVRHAVRFIRENPGGNMSIGEAMQLAYGSDVRRTGIPVLGVDAEGWVGALLHGETEREALPVMEPPASFRGTLRPYQVRGMSWMAFLERFGLGVCLADDMGLGKTIQLLALLLLEREQAEQTGESIGPTLLVVPMSVVGNWVRETERFAPELRVHMHHGPERPSGEALAERAGACDVVITTYALANRDRDDLDRVAWRRVVLDEAQCIKNPQAKQTQAVRSLTAERRIALTGTPVENRLSELWSIMDFLNPGYLGSSPSFRKRFGVPIERYKDAGRSRQLRGLVQPFVLRRLKTDPTVVSDLPEKLETKEHCHLTSEQASLYESCVKRMLTQVEGSDGMQRRGLVLSALIKLKQICNHPSQLLKDHDASSASPPDPSRSGKCIRLIEMLDEVLAEGDQALVFTQFRQMGHLLSLMLRHELGREVLFLHGGTPQGQRDAMIQSFQRADGTRPILILSLKAGGVGLNLTAANHVFHFDRWWNPAVENQATDRAFRIGQTRTVMVHKYLVRGTLEERIDAMIEQKTELAENIVGSGERWLTELSTDDLRDILTLRHDAVDTVD